MSNKPGAPKGNTNRKGKLKPDRKDDRITFRVKSDIKSEMIKTAEALNLSLQEHIVRASIGRRK